MFRVVDVWKALEKLVYPQGHAEFTLRVIDTYAPWNQVPIRVEVSNGKAKVYRSEDEDYDLVIDVKAFSQLYVGYRSLEQLIDIGKAVVNENKIKAISTIFPRRKTRVLIDF